MQRTLVDWDVGHCRDCWALIELKAPMVLVLGIGLVTLADRGLVLDPSFCVERGYAMLLLLKIGINDALCKEFSCMYSNE